jgi:hypothetical protein
MSHPGRSVTSMDTANATPLPLPFDDGLDAPIDFSLTPRARRTVVPDRLPPLRLVAPDERSMSAAPAAAHDAPNDDDPSDVRPAQARALRRSGMPVTTIAAALGMAPDVIERWTVGATPTRRRARVAAAGRTGERVARAAVPAPGPPQVPPVRPAQGPDDAEGRRSSAIGMAVALATLDDDGADVTFTHTRVAVLAAILVELRRQLPLDGRCLRVAVRASERFGVDRARSEVARALQVADEQVLAGRWRDADGDDAMEVTLRVIDRDAVGVVAAWIDQVRMPVGDSARH